MLVALLAACAPSPDDSMRDSGLQEAVDGPVLELAPPGGEYGELRDGAELWCGIPPQGGAPFSPIQVRLYGADEAMANGVAIEAIAADSSSGEPLIYTALTMSLILSNTGENEGAWVGPEVHLRYEGWSLDALAGRSALLGVRATSLSDPGVSAHVMATVHLTTE